MMAPVNRLPQVPSAQLGRSVGWPAAAQALPAQPPYEGPGAPAPRPLSAEWVGQSGLMVLTPGQAQPGAQAILGDQGAAAPRDWVALAGGWLGSAWATFRSGLGRLAAAMGPTPPAEGAAGGAAVAALELVGGVAQTAMTPVVAAMGAAGQAGVAVAEATAPAWQAAGQGLVRVAEAAAGGAAAVGQGVVAVAEAVGQGVASLGQGLAAGWQAFWGAFQGQARR